MVINKMPTDLVLAITYNCNARCRMCNIWKSEDTSYIDIEQYKKLPTKFEYINVTGGEPFLHPQIIDIVKILSDKNPNAQIIISSNGLATELIKKGMIEILKIKPQIGVSFSLDGINEKHAEVRGIENAYDKVMKTIKEVQSLGMTNIRLAFTAGDYNIEHLNKVYALANKLNIGFTIAAVHSAENYFNISDNKITKFDQFKKEFKIYIKQELKQWNLKKMLRAYFAYALLQFVLTGKRLLPNYSGQQNIFIDPQGNVYPSDVSGNSMGNLKDFKNFKQLYNSSKSQKSITLEKKHQNWMMCTARLAMRKHPIKVLSWVLRNKFFGLSL